MVEKFGRYLFIDKRILFCYDKEKENCLKPGITLIVSKQGIKVDEEEDADILFLLAARNKIENLKVISELIRLIEKKKIIIPSYKIYHVCERNQRIFFVID